ncbi:OmpH family outer membrane protein [Pedobacter sp. Hv1]|uniref:OmpH family outer membrane protein n=1 Tax=Pedobacter sp. Hv1 TaxID=1740090 RepID=UPI001F1DD130|nr:OmpH family outer membrane protein [Pedobacter sp. Hv1]
MKKPNLIPLQASIKVMLSLLFIMGLQNVSAQQKIGHIDSQTVYSLMPEFKTAQTSLDLINKTKTAELNKMKTEIQTKYDQGVAKNKTLSEANKDVVLKELQVMDNELESLKKRLETSYQKAEQDIAAKETELFTPIRTKFINAVKLVSKEKGLAYVFDISKNQDNNLLAWDDGIDITNAVKDKLGIVAAAAGTTKK